MYENIYPAALYDIRNVRVNSQLPKREKIAEHVRQIGNPYHYKCGKFTITEKFQKNGPSIEQCLQGMMA